MTSTGRAVERDHVALSHGDVADGERVAVDLDGLGADHRGHAPPAGHDRGVADEPASRCEDALGHDHAVHVFGGGLAAHEDDLLAPARRVGGAVGGEVHLADGRARRGGETRRDHLQILGGELRVQHLVEVVAGDAHDRLVLRQAM